MIMCSSVLVKMFICPVIMLFMNIKNITEDDCGFYICQQWTGVNRNQKQGTDARVYLHVLLGKFMIM